MTIEADALFSNDPRHKDNSLLLDLNTVNPCVSTNNLENTAHRAGKHLAGAFERKNKASELFPRYLPPPLSRYIDVWRAWSRRACPYQGHSHQSGEVQEPWHLVEGRDIARLRDRLFAYALLLYTGGGPTYSTYVHLQDTAPSKPLGQASGARV